MKFLITGAGGSIGRELCRQVARWGPSALILLGHGENSIYETLLELEKLFPTLPVHPVIADIRDIDHLNVIFDNYYPQVVFHTAAHKHVPLMEINVEEAVTNNILGTRNIVEVAANFTIEQFVMISTDKAIRPTSVYGATNRFWMQLIVQDCCFPLSALATSWAAVEVLSRLFRVKLTVVGRLRLRTLIWNGSS